MKIVSSIPTIDLIKSKVDTIASTQEIGTSETSGVKGVNKSFKLTNTKGESFLFKPAGGEHTSRWRYIPAHKQYLRERAAYLVDKQLGFGLVPLTKIVKFKGEIGSLHKWVDAEHNPDITLRKYSDDTIWKVGLLDLVIGNVDRHCLSGNTRIKLLDGTLETMENLSKKQESYYVYGIIDRGKIVAARASPARVTGENVPLYKVKLDSGKVVEATPEHLFMLRNGEYKAAINLKEGDSLMPLYWKYNSSGNALRGYELVYQLYDQKWHYTHRLIFGSKARGTIIHHKDFNYINNCPNNLQGMSNLDHAMLHSVSKLGRTNEEIFGEETARIIRLRKSKAMRGDKNPSKRPEIREKIGASKRGKTYGDMYGAERAVEISKNISANSRRLAPNKGKKYEDYMTIEQSRSIKERRNKINHDRLIGKTYEEIMGVEKAKITREKLRLQAHTPEKIAISINNISKAWDKISEKQILSRSNNAKRLNGKRWSNKKLWNHKVVSVEYMGIADKVYDITTDTGNFALEAGIFVHNSGNQLDYDHTIAAIDHGYSFPAQAETSDPRSVILSRFAYRIWRKAMPERYLTFLLPLKDINFQNHIRKLVGEEAFNLFKERIDALLKGVAKFPKYRIVEKIKGIPPEKDK